MDYVSYKKIKSGDFVYSTTIFPEKDNSFLVNIYGRKTTCVGYCYGSSTLMFPDGEVILVKDNSENKVFSEKNSCMYYSDLDVCLEDAMNSMCQMASEKKRGEGKVGRDEIKVRYQEFKITG